MRLQQPHAETATFIQVQRGAVHRVWTVTADLNNRRVTTVARKAGSRGRKTVRRFANRADIRRYVTAQIHRTTARGFLPLP